MTIVASWNGDGLSDGTTFNTSTAGTGDNNFDVVSGSFTIRNGGLYSPRIEMNQQSGQAAEFRWTEASLGVGPYPQHALRFYLELTGHPPGNGQLCSAKAMDNSNFWWMDITSAGILRLRDTGGSAKALSSAALPIDQELRIEVVADGTDVSVFVYVGESTVPIQTLNGTGFSGVVATHRLQFGNTNTTPTYPKTSWDSIAFADEAVLIGAINPEEPPTTSLYLWDGSEELPLSVDGVWDGSVAIPMGSIEVA